MAEYIVSSEIPAVVPEKVGSTDPAVNTGQAMAQKKTIFRTYQAIWYILGFIETVLAFRFVLKFFGANAASGFASFIYAISYPFAAPFLNLFGNSAGGRVVIEWSVIVGMVVYYIVAWGLIKLFQMVKPAGRDEVVEKVDAPEAKL